MSNENAMNRRRFWLRAMWLFLVAAGLAAVYVGGTYFVRPEVVVAPVERGAAVDAVPGVVEASARYTLELRSEAGGRVIESDVETGDRVEVGQLLFRLDPEDLEAEKERVQIEFETEQALQEIGSLLRYDIEEAREELEHKRELYEDGEYSRRELDVQKRRVARLSDEIRREAIRDRQRLRALEQELERLDRELDRTFVRAPMDGDLVDLYAYPGDVVGPRARLARLLSAERLIEASISEEDFAGVQVGQSATVRFLSYGRRLFQGEISRVLPSADPDTQRYTVYLEVDMPEELIVPGITGEVSIVRDERENAVIIPRRALFGREVFVVRDAHVELREVETGFVSLNRVEIVSGLEEGDQVVVEDLDRLRDGDRVRIRGHVR